MFISILNKPTTTFLWMLYVLHLFTTLQVISVRANPQNNQSVIWPGCTLGILVKPALT